MVTSCVVMGTGYVVMGTGCVAKYYNGFWINLGLNSSLHTCFCIRNDYVAMGSDRVVL